MVTVMDVSDTEVVNFITGTILNAWIDKILFAFAKISRQ